MKTNILDGAVAYLAGAIERADDDGIIWRDKIKKILKQKNICLTLLDPTHKPGGLIREVGSEKQNLQQLREKKDWEGLRCFVKKVVRCDLRMVDLSDFVIAMIDIDIHHCGTYSEIFLADDQHKPVLLIVKGGKDKCPTWLFGVIHYKYIFDSIDECVDYLVKVNAGEVELDDKWVLIREGIRKLEVDALEK